jgi:hypothetical protein
VAGLGTAGYSGDGGAATLAELYAPRSIAVDRIGNIYIAEELNHIIRKIDTFGIISTFAGTGITGFSGDGGAATTATFNSPSGVEVDDIGNVYISDRLNHRVRMVDTDGVVTTIAGIGGCGFFGDGGLATSATICNPYHIATFSYGNIYFCDRSNNRIRMITVPNSAPYFVKGAAHTFTICPGETDIDTLLGVIDSDMAQILTWSVAAAPMHGALAVSCFDTANGGLVYPTGAMYNPFAGYSGYDTFKVRVTDGMKSDTITLHIYTLPAPNAGTISGADTVCLGTTVNFTDTATGGVWSIGGGAASVSSAGAVMGVSPGTGTLSYSVTNICGTAVATRLITVVDCYLGVGALSSKTAWVSPNPNNGTFTLYLPATSTADATITITDVTGRTVNALVTDSGRPFTVSIPNATKGLYFLRTETGMGLGVIKVIVE